MKKLIGVELIGKTVLVTHADNPSLQGLSGKVVDETRNTLKLSTDKGRRTLVKSQITLSIDGIEVRGDDIIGRIEERIKKSW